MGRPKTGAIETLPDGRHRVRVTTHGKRVDLGTYDSRAEAELARLTAPVEHTQPALKGRATDEELFAIARAAYDTEPAPHVPWLSRVARAVAARVRQEPGLLERLVEAGWDMTLEQNNGTVDMWLTRPKTNDDEGEHFGGDLVEREAPNVAPAEVPATIARLAGLEVGR